jgi:serine/threonine-protein kinase
VIVKLAKGDAGYHRKYTFDYRVRVFMEICKAVEFAHARGVIHRDLKPANVMVGEHGEVMVMDWGIAKHVAAGGNGARRTEPESAMQIPDFDDQPADPPGGGTPSFDRMAQTEHQSIVGTPLYMSPEQALGRVDELDERSDVYSLCAMLYELLTLAPYLPPKKTMRELLVAVVTEEPRHAHFLDHPHQQRVPAQFANFLVKGLAKSPDDRYRSVAEMRELLQRIGEGRFSIECPITFIKWPLHALLRFVDRHPKVTVYGLLVAVLGLVGLGVFTISGAVG